MVEQKKNEENKKKCKKYVSKQKMEREGIKERKYAGDGEKKEKG